MARKLIVGSIYSSTGLFGAYGGTVPPIANMWLAAEHDYFVQNHDIDIEVRLVDIGSNATLAAFAAKDLIVNQQADVLMAPEAYLTSVVAGVAAAHGGVPVLAGSSAAGADFRKPVTGARRFANLFGTMTPATHYFGTFLSMVHIRGLLRVSFVWLASPPDSEVCLGALADARELSRMTVVSTYNSSVANPDAVIWETLMQQVAADAPDVLITCNRLACKQMLRALSATGWTPAVLGMFECAASYAAKLQQDVGSLAQFVISPVQWDKRLRGRAFTDDVNRPYASMFVPTDVDARPSALQFHERLVAAMPPGQAVTSIAPCQMACYYLLGSALALGNSTSRGDLLNALARVNMPSFYGIIAMNELGVNDVRDISLVQIDHNHEVQLIEPLSSATSSPTFPIPTWNERVAMSQSGKQSTAARTVAILAGILSLVAGIVLVMLWVLRHTKTMRASSPVFSALTLLGAVFAVCAPLTWTLDDDQSSCNARVPTFALAVTVSLTPLIAKTVRIAMIFRHKSLRAQIVRDRQVLALALAFSLPALIITLIWGLAPELQLRSTMVVPDPQRPALNFHSCTAMGNSQPILIASLTYVAGLLALGVAVAAIVQNVPEAYAQFNDAQPIALTVYNLAWMLLVTTIVSIVFQSSQRTAVFLLRSLGVQLSFAVSMVILFARRLGRAWAERRGQLTTGTDDGHGTKISDGTAPASREAFKPHSKGSVAGLVGDRAAVTTPGTSPTYKTTDGSKRSGGPYLLQPASSSQDAPLPVRNAFAATRAKEAASV